MPVSNDIAHTAELPVIWGTQGFQGLDIGFFVAHRRARRLLG